MKKSTVKCVVRVKPTTSFPSENITLGDDGKTIAILLKRKDSGGAVNNQQERFSFSYDRVLNSCTQEAVYDECGVDVINGGLEGYNGTLMCYGQTGAGKTFTMSGAAGSYQHRGVVPRAISHLFKEVKARPDTAFVIKISYLEVYNEQMYDLLNPEQQPQPDVFTDKPSTPPSSDPGTAASPSAAAGIEPLKILEDSNGVTRVKGVRMVLVNSEEEALNALFEGEMNRTIAEHQLNKSSTRSHCIFTIHLDMRSRVESTEKVLLSKLNFVDLAGSERLAKTQSEGIILKEAMYINKSLSFLEQVILALGNKKREHIPYRQSKLTNLLKDSLGGNCRTVLIANVWADASHLEETTATLRFASRMALVANNAVVNVQYDPLQLIRKYEKEIKELKAELAMHDQIAGRSHVSYEPLGEEAQALLRQKVRQFIDGEVEELEIVNIKQIRELFAQFRSIIREAESEGDGKAAAKVPKPVPAAEKTVDPKARKLVPSMTTAATTPDPAKIATMQTHQPGVGEVEGGGFAIGLAPLDPKQKTGRTGGDRALSPPPGPPPKTGESPAPGQNQGDKLQASQQASGQAAQQLPPLKPVTKVTSPRGGPAPPPPVAIPVLGVPVAAPKVDDSSATEAGAKEEGKKGRRGKREEKSKKEDDKNVSRKGRRRRGDQDGEGDRGELQPSISCMALNVETPAQASEEQPPDPPKPSDKNEAFEMFKTLGKGGAEQYKSLTESKNSLKDKKALLKAEANAVNETKKLIDSLKVTLEAKREERRKQPDYDGENEVIDEDEFEAMKRMKEAKKEYKEHFDSVQALKGEVEYLVRLVDQGRQRLLADFEEWFGDRPPTGGSVVPSGDKPQQSSTQMDDGMAGQSGDVGGDDSYMDHIERFERLQNEGAAPSDPEARAYMNAIQSAKKKKLLANSSSSGYAALVAAQQGSVAPAPSAPAASTGIAAPQQMRKATAPKQVIT